MNDETAAEIRDGMRRSVERRKVRKSLIDTLIDIADSVGSPDGLEGVGGVDGAK